LAKKGPSFDKSDGGHGSVRKIGVINKAPIRNASAHEGTGTEKNGDVSLWGGCSGKKALSKEREQDEMWVSPTQKESYASLV